MMNRQMAYSIYVSGTGYSGKTALCLGLFGKLQEMGLRVGYFKPVGMGQKLVDGKLRDTDVVLMKEVMGLEEDLDALCPVVLGKRYLDLIAESCDDSRERIMEAYERISADKDILLIEAAEREELGAGSRLDEEDVLVGADLLVGLHDQVPGVVAALSDDVEVALPQHHRAELVEVLLEGHHLLHEDYVGVPQLSVDELLPHADGLEVAHSEPHLLELPEQA